MLSVTSMVSWVPVNVEEVTSRRRVSSMFRLRRRGRVVRRLAHHGHASAREVRCGYARRDVVAKAGGELDLVVESRDHNDIRRRAADVFDEFSAYLWTMSMSASPMSRRSTAEPGMVLALRQNGSNTGMTHGVRSTFAAASVRSSPSRGGRWGT